MPKAEAPSRLASAAIIYQSHRFLIKQISEQQAIQNLLCCARRNDTLKGALVLSYLERITQEEFCNFIRPKNLRFLTPALKEAYEKRKTELMPFAKGTDAYNFSLSDVNDKVVSLKDLRGKVVVLDIWAMWCAPCLQEKPYFRKIEEEYKNNKEIVFISVSTDGLAKKEIWKGFVKKKGWDGIELNSEPTNRCEVL
jgi:thiol-disulfide isomerase/thioredoxin